MDLVQRGSQTAKDGFRNEQDICDKFNHWQSDNEAKQWLTIMQYDLEEIEYVRAIVLHGYKADVNVQVQIKLKSAVDTENIQVKLVSNQKGFNQVDKRWLSHYKEMWCIPDNVFKLLQYYTGELKPYKAGVRDSRRMFIDEFSPTEQALLLDWFTQNKTLVLSDIIKGRGQFSAEWVLVAQKLDNNARWVLVNINQALQHYANGGGGGAKTGLYKIDLPDGNYIIRKLEPIECERLQTLPDNYTAYGIDGKISNTQRYKCVGNGWTVDVIAHIFSFLKQELDKQ